MKCPFGVSPVPSCVKSLGFPDPPFTESVMGVRSSPKARFRRSWMGYGKERIKADCAEPKSIDELRDAGLHRIRAARKGKDSVNNGIQYIQGYTIIVHPRCVNFITEISNYTWAEDKFGAKINVPIDDFNHLMDAMRYGLEDMLVGPAFSFD